MGQLKLFDRHAVNLLAVSCRGRRITHRLRGVKLGPGRRCFQGNLAAMPETLGELHCLPLAERDLRIGRKASLLPSACSPSLWGLSLSTSFRSPSRFLARLSFFARPFAFPARGL